MIPGLAGVVLVFVGIIITSLGVVRERQTGTLEQLAVMPLRPRDVFLGKIVPYFAVAAVDLVIVLAVGVALFGVPFRGSYAVFALGALLFLFVTLGIGVLISSVSENQGQAIQMSFMFTLPQVLLSGLIFPLSSIAVGVRWISYLLPLTYFNEISRGVMLRAEPIGPLWPPLLFLALLGLVVMTLAMLRFRSYLSPAGSGGGRSGPAGGARRGRRSGPGGRGRGGVPVNATPGPQPPGPQPPGPQPPGPQQAAGGWGTRAVSVRYGRRLALDQVTFRCLPGQVSAVVGGDGAGRTTLLRCLSGAVAPSEGTVTRPPRIQTGYLAAGSGTYPDLTVAENLAFRAAAYRIPAAVAGPRIRRLPGTGRAAGGAGPAGRAAVRRDAPEARCHRRDAAPSGPAGARRADHRRGPGQPGRPVVADRARRRRGCRGGLRHQLPGRGGTRSPRPGPRGRPGTGRGLAGTDRRGHARPSPGGRRAARRPGRGAVLAPRRPLAGLVAGRSRGRPGGRRRGGPA